MKITGHGARSEFSGLETDHFRHGGITGQRGVKESTYHPTVRGIQFEEKLTNISERDYRSAIPLRPVPRGSDLISFHINPSDVSRKHLPKLAGAAPPGCDFSSGPFYSLCLPDRVGLKSIFNRASTVRIARRQVRKQAAIVSGIAGDFSAAGYPP